MPESYNAAAAAARLIKDAAVGPLTDAIAELERTNQKGSLQLARDLKAKAIAVSKLIEN